MHQQKYQNAWFAKPSVEMYSCIYPLQAPFWGKKKIINNNKEKTTDLDFERVSFGTNLQFYLLICLSNTHRWWENYTKIMDKLARGEGCFKRKGNLNICI